MNYLIIEKNDLYTDIYELLEDKELTMHKLDDRELVYFHINQYIENSKYIKYSETFKTNEDRLNNIFEYLKDESIVNEIDTILLFSNDEIMYELMYIDYKNKDDNNLNHFACISNIEEYPIYNTVIVLKTDITKEKKSTIINKKDISFIIYNNFYHDGLMIDNNDEKILTFSGDKPFNLIGNTFRETEKKEVLGLAFILYEENKEDYINKKISILFEKEIKGRCFLMVIAPIKYRKFWNLNNKILDKLVNISLDKKKYNEIEKKIYDDINPFILFNIYI